MQLAIMSGENGTSFFHEPWTNQIRVENKVDLRHCGI
jgi:hypothetical protein